MNLGLVDRTCLIRALLASCLVTLGACGPMHRLGYDTSSIPPQQTPALNASITVQPFVDKRRDNQPGSVFSSEENPAVIDNKLLCFNAEKGYGGRVPEDLAAVITRHLGRRRVFKPQNDRAAKYLLEGTIIELYGRQIPGSIPASATFGVVPVGMLADGEQQSTHIAITFADLRLRNATDGTVNTLPDVKINFWGKLSADRGCTFIFAHVDNQLRDAVEKLIMSAERAARSWSTGGAASTARSDERDP